MTSAWYEIKVACPYCERTATVLARDINGELRAMRCVECSAVYVVEVFVAVTHAVRALVPESVVVDQRIGGEKPKRRVRSVEGSQY